MDTESSSCGGSTCVLSKGTEKVMVEVQIRTIAMDFGHLWSMSWFISLKMKNQHLSLMS